MATMREEKAQIIFISTERFEKTSVLKASFLVCFKASHTLLELIVSLSI